MPDINPDSYCGIWCGACSIARHGETGRADAFVACFGGRVPGAELACRGCKSGVLYAGCAACPMRQCAVGRGVEHCVECADYPCRTYRRWSANARLLPHVGESAGNLETIRRLGMHGWLEEQRSRWSCPRCGGRFSWYQAACPGCGGSLDGYTIGGVKRLFLGLLFPILYRKAKAAQARPKGEDSA